ncbi:hypothetical protein NM688_g8819 [Phlebia brevispora]|uniref:Uncharacterized protein n=1 Tax=Phlebia brevispora TaxID=194682 RepID=A0ACC1RNV4_9APHY|nr:hypothetical protein NM688_g8819 [Phlebia brevispora]
MATLVNRHFCPPSLAPVQAPSMHLERLPPCAGDDSSESTGTQIRRWRGPSKLRVAQHISSVGAERKAMRARICGVASNRRDNPGNHNHENCLLIVHVADLNSEFEDG